MGSPVQSCTQSSKQNDPRIEEEKILWGCLHPILFTKRRIFIDLPWWVQCKYEE